MLKICSNTKNSLYLVKLFFNIYQKLNLIDIVCFLNVKIIKMCSKNLFMSKLSIAYGTCEFWFNTTFKFEMFG